MIVLKKLLDIPIPTSFLFDVEEALNLARLGPDKRQNTETKDESPAGDDSRSILGSIKGIFGSKQSPDQDQQNESAPKASTWTTMYSTQLATLAARLKTSGKTCCCQEAANNASKGFGTNAGCDPQEARIP
jgi:hypothetical protein